MGLSRYASVLVVSMIRTMATLDPSWRTLYMYGGNMLGVCDKVDEADVIFKLGHQNLPDDYYFPFSLAMNAYQEHKDYDAAEKWMRVAVEKEGLQLGIVLQWLV